MPDTPPQSRNELASPNAVTATKRTASSTTVCLDHTAYSHLIDHILSHLTYPDLLPFRATSQAFSKKVTMLLSHHLRITRHTQWVHITTALPGYTYTPGHPVGAVLSLCASDDGSHTPVLRGLSPPATRILTVAGRVPPHTDPLPRLHGLAFAAAPTAIVFRHLVPVPAGDARARSLVCSGGPAQPDAVARLVNTIAFSRRDLRLWHAQILPCSAGVGVAEVVFRFAEVSDNNSNSNGGDGDGAGGRRDSGLEEEEEEEDADTALLPGVFVAPPGLLSLTLQRMAHVLHRVSFTIVGLAALGAAALGFAPRTDEEEVVEALREVLVAERRRWESEWDLEDEAGSGGSRGGGPIAPEDVLGSEEAVREVVGRMVRFISEEEYVAQWPEEARLSEWQDEW